MLNAEELAELKKRLHIDYDDDDARLQELAAAVEEDMRLQGIAPDTTNKLWIYARNGLVGCYYDGDSPQLLRGILMRLKLGQETEDAHGVP